LQAEVSALGKARAALGRRDGQTALEELDLYTQAFPAGLLADEATVLRVDALALSGEATAAAALGRRYLGAHPTSPYGAHLRAVIEGEQNP
jgi:outer membrane protein assembly factor BamD (BamD/ComL family)